MACVCILWQDGVSYPVSAYCDGLGVSCSVSEYCNGVGCHDLSVYCSMVGCYVM